MREVLGDAGAGGFPLAAVKVFGVGESALGEADAAETASRQGSQIAEERDDGLGVEAEVEGVAGVQLMGRFFIDLSVRRQDGCVYRCVQLAPDGYEVVRRFGGARAHAVCNVAVGGALLRSRCESAICCCIRSANLKGAGRLGAQE